MEDPAEAASADLRPSCAATSCAWSRPARSPKTRLLDAGRNNYLAALRPAGRADGHAIAWIDISTGDLHARRSTRGLAADLARLEPGGAGRRQSVSEASLRAAVRARAADAAAAGRLRRRDGRTTADFFLWVATMEAFGAFSRMEPPPAAFIATSSGHRSASLRRCRRPSAKIPAPQWQSTPPRAPISN